MLAPKALEMLPIRWLQRDSASAPGKSGNLIILGIDRLW